MPKAFHPRQSGGRGQRRTGSARPELPREIIDELRTMCRPGRGDEVVASMDRAARHLERGDPAGAGREAARAKALASRSPTVREMLGLALYQQERYREALSEMQAYRRMSGRADQNHIIADCERALGRPERAVPLAEEALSARIRPDVKAEAVIVAASALADSKRYDQALALLRRFRTRDDVAEPYALRVWYVTADVLARAGRRDEARREFRKIMRYDSAAFDVAERLVQLG